MSLDDIVDLVEVPLGKIFLRSDILATCEKKERTLSILVRSWS